jgi:glucokinase-like ROK family protein
METERWPDLGRVSASPRSDLPAGVLTLLRDRGPLPMTHLSEYRGVSRSKVGQEVAELGRLGLVVRGGQAPSRGGRPSSIVSLSNEVRYAGVDVGATSIAVALTDGYLEVLEFIEEDADVHRGPDVVLGRVIELIRELVARRPVSTLAGVGIGVPGPVSFRDGRVVGAPLQMPGWERYPIRDRLTRELNLRVTVDNDANAMALGEAHAGAARGARDFLFVKLGTGVGSAIVTNGILHRGADGCAGEISHNRIVESQSLCSCGRTGCLNAEFGGAALTRQAIVAAQSRESPMLARMLEANGSLTPADVGAASAAGDAYATQMILRGGRLVGEALASLINVLNPSRIVVGGGLLRLGPLLLAEIKSAALQSSTPLATTNLAIVQTALGDGAGVIGAAWLASETLIDSIAGAKETGIPRSA